MSGDKPVVKELSKKVDIEVAEKDMSTWLDAKRITESGKETYKDQIETITNAIMDGILSLNDDNSFTHNLLFHIEGDSPISTLEYKSRLKVSTVHSHLKGIKPGDADARICAYVGALTSNPSAVIKGLDTQDYSIAQAISVFFL